MARPAYPWKAIFAELDSGASREEVCQKYGCSMGTLRNKLRSRTKPTAPAKKPPATDNTLPFPSRPERVRTRETAEERKARKRKEAHDHHQKARAERIAQGARAAGLNRDTLQRAIATANDQLLTSITEGDSRAAKDYAGVLTTLSEKLGAILSTESQFTAGEDTGPDLDSPEGRQQIADRLSDDPALLSLCDVDTLEAALAMARRKQA
jgi:transposase-like protein